MRRPLLIAHSGFADTPPNSLATIEAAKTAGADGVEFDVQCSAEGAPVLSHDPRVVSSAGLERNISALSSTAIGAGAFMVPGIPDAPPALLEVIDGCHAAGLLLNLDVKDTRAFPAIRQALRRARYAERTFVTGCGLDALANLGRPIPEVSLLVNVDSEMALDQIVHLGAQGINIEHSLITPELLTAARKRFLSVAVWTVNEPEELQRVVELGVDSVTSNRPTRIRVEPSFRNSQGTGDRGRTPGPEKAERRACPGG
ncbi:MAG: glycerophosphodiester phosphodiesterase [Spirochaetota bacterium]